MAEGYKGHTLVLSSCEIQSMKSDRVAAGIARCLGWLRFLYATERVSRSVGGMERRGGWSRICSVLVSGRLWGQGEALYSFCGRLM